MTSRHHQRLREIFLGARELPDASRAAYLEEACAGHPDLRREVEGMLAFNDEDGHFLLVPPPLPESMAEALEPSVPVQERVAKLAGQSNSRTRFDLVGELAEGGMGKILEVFDTDLRRSIAMKIMRGQPEHESGETPLSPAAHWARLARFLEEAQVTGQLEHPGVVPVHELGVDAAGRVYFTMRRVQGKDLGRIFEHVRARDGTWTSTRAVGILQRVCETMAFAHDRGILHRDLKPANVMVGDYGEVYVMDWGLAAVRGSADHHDLRPQVSRADTPGDAVTTDRQAVPVVTMDGAVVGTPHFMSPEQAAGRSREVDERSDVYAVGAMLYQLLTERMPFAERGSSGSAHEVLAALKDGPPRAVERLAPDAPAELVAICEKAMERDRDRRYAGMKELAADLSSYLEGRVVTAHRTGAMVELKKWIQRNRSHATTILMMVASVIVGLMISTDQYLEARAGRGAANLALDEARRQSYMANVSAAARSQEAGDYGEAGLRLGNCEPDLRGWEWRHVALQQDLALRTRRVHDGPIKGLDVTADGRTVMTAGWDGRVRLWDATTLQLIDESRTRNRMGMHTAAVSPDGRRVLQAAEGRSKLELHHVGSGRAPHELADSEEPVKWRVLSARFFDDGRRVVTGAQDGIVRVFDIESGEVLFRRPIADGSKGIPGVDVSWAQDRIATGVYEVVVWSFPEGRELLRVETPEYAQAIRFHPDGRRLAAGLFDGRIRIYSLVDGSTLRDLSGHDQAVTSLDFSGTGDVLVSASRDGTLRVWDFEQGREAAVLQAHFGEVHACRLHPDGRRVYSAGRDGMLREWDLGTRSAASTIQAHANAIQNVGFSGDGKRLVSSSRYEIRVWHAGTLEPERTLPGDTYATAVIDDCIVTGNAWGDNVLQVIELESGRTLARFPGRPASRMAVAPGGRVYLNPDGSPAVLDLATREWESIEGDWTKGGFAIAVHPDEHLLVKGAAHWIGDLHTLDLLTGERKVLEAHSDSITALAFQPDGSRFVSGSRDADLRVWDTRTLRCIELLRGHARDVTCVAYSPNGDRIFSGSRDGTLRVWNPVEGALLATFHGHSSEITALAVSPDGQRVATGDARGFLRLWNTEASDARRCWASEGLLQAILPRIHAIEGRYLSREHALAELRADTSLTPAELAFGDRWLQNLTRPLGRRLRDRMWKTATDPELPRRAYRDVVSMGAEIEADQPLTASMLHTLSVAHLRLGEYARALERFDEARSSLTAAAYRRVQANYEVWEAMCHHHLGDHRQAAALLASVRSLIAAGGSDGGRGKFLREAELLIEGKPSAGRDGR